MTLLISPVIFERITMRLRDFGIASLTGWEHLWLYGASGDDALDLERYGFTLIETGHGRRVITDYDFLAGRCPCGMPLRAPEGERVAVVDSVGAQRVVGHPEGVPVCRECLSSSRISGDDGCRTRDGEWTCR